MQYRRDSRKVDGFLLYDKPLRVSSNAALQQLRRLYRAERAGHTGTLDPLASGLMLICFGRATRFAGELLASSKTYLAEITLGITTDTGDSEGAVLEVREIPYPETAFEETLAGFQGEIMQTPPMYSALKQGGVPLYRMARQGREVHREPRRISIFSLLLEGVSLPRLKIRVTCSKGTYIRVLAEDIGAALGCGAHLSGLRRTDLGGFRLDDAYRLDQLQEMSESQRDACLQPTDRLISNRPALTLSEDGARRFVLGQAIPAGPIGSLVEGETRVYQESGVFLGTGLVDASGVVHPKRVFAP